MDRESDSRVVDRIFLGLKAYKEDRNLNLSSEEVSIQKIVRIAAFYGASTCLLFIAMIMTGGVLEGNFVWSIEGISGTVLVSIVLGIVVTIGSAIKFI